MDGEVDFPSVLHSLWVEGGGLVEIYAFEARLDQWQSTVEWLSGSDLILSIDSDDSHFRVPRVVSDFFAVDGDARATMFCKVGRQQWWTSFYSPDCIDFQGDPERVENVNDLMDVVEFMKGLSRAAGRATVLVAETTRPELAKPYIRVSAAGEVE